MDFFLFLLALIGAMYIGYSLRGGGNPKPSSIEFPRPTTTHLIFKWLWRGLFFLFAAGGAFFLIQLALILIK